MLFRKVKRVDHAGETLITQESKLISLCYFQFYTPLDISRYDLSFSGDSMYKYQNFVGVPLKVSGSLRWKDAGVIVL